MLARLTELELSNFKNVEHGEIKFPNYQSVETKGDILKSDITGIYGQNGSGKTAVVEALDVVKNILSGNSVPFSDYSGIINEGAKVSLCFFVYDDTKKIKVKYTVGLKQYGSAVGIPWETLSFWTRGIRWKNEQFIKVINPYYSDEAITNDANVSLELKGSGFEQYDFIEHPDKLAVFCAAHGQSFLFNSYTERLLAEKDTSDDFKAVIQTLQIFAKRHFFVVRLNQLAGANNQNNIPLNVCFTDKNCVLYGCLPVFINGIGTISETLYPSFKKVLDSINSALSAIILDLKLEPKIVGKDKTPDGIDLIRFEMYSVRNGKSFSTKYESEGIKRIISLLSCIISAFNDAGISLVVDELDSGIFEYLLGEILSAIEKESKGQIIFTSHNLRAFEKLPSSSIYCSTTNPQNRYVKLTGITANNNKRDFYIRSLILGGQKELLYSSEDLNDIGYAFRQAGRQSEVPNEHQK